VDRPTKEEAIKESLILWRELATNPKHDGFTVKRGVVRSLVSDGVLPPRALQYENSCPLCAYSMEGDRECIRCPWPGRGCIRCKREGVYGLWVKRPSHGTARPVFELMKQLAKVEAQPTFKVGDRVKLVDMKGTEDQVYADDPVNPLWGGKEGKVRGTVTGPLNDPYYTLCVKWDNGQDNHYAPRNLALLTAADEQPTFKVGDRVKLVNLLYENGDEWSDGSLNPLWGGKRGKVRGTVNQVGMLAASDHYLVIGVEWDNGFKNQYNQRNLALLTAEEDRIDIVAGQLYHHEGQVILATYDDGFIAFYDLKGHSVASDGDEGDVFSADYEGYDVHRNKLIPTGKSLQDLYARAQ